MTKKVYRRFYGEHYSIKLLVETTRIVAQVINDIVYENLLSVNLSYLLLDLNKVNDALLFQLGESVEAYIEAEERTEERRKEA